MPNYVYQYQYFSFIVIIYLYPHWFWRYLSQMYAHWDLRPWSQTDGVWHLVLLLTKCHLRSTDFLSLNVLTCKCEECKDHKEYSAASRCEERWCVCFTGSTPASAAGCHYRFRFQAFNILKVRRTQNHRSTHKIPYRIIISKENKDT